MTSSKDSNSSGLSVAKAWMNPAWITAIVGLLSLFLTVPEVVSTYLTNQQKIELAKVEYDRAQIENVGLQEEQEFRIVSDTLAHQGPERIFVLRYLAATIDDPDARAWAANEVTRVEEITKKQEQFEIAQRKLMEKERQLSDAVVAGTEHVQQLEEQVVALQESLALKNVEISTATLDAGITPASQRSIQDILYVQFRGALKRELMNELRETLNEHTIPVPGVERVSGAYRNSVRFFHSNDSDIASTVKSATKDFFAAKGCPVAEIELKDLSSSRYSEKVKQGQLELWIHHSCNNR